MSSDDNDSDRRRSTLPYDVIQEIVGVFSLDEGEEDGIHNTHMEQGSSNNGLIGKGRDRTDLLEDEEDNGNLISDTPSNAEALHMTKPNDEKKRSQHPSPGAHRIPGMDVQEEVSSNMRSGSVFRALMEATTNTAAGVDNYDPLSDTNDNNAAPEPDSIPGSHWIAGRTPNSDDGNTPGPRDATEATMMDFDESEVTLITAAEVFDESSEEFRRKEARMEEEIKQRLMASAVEANEVLPVVAEEEKALSRGGLMGLMFAFLVIAIILVILLVVLLPRDNSTDDADEEGMELVFQIPPDETVIAQVPTTICYERIPLFGSSELCQEEDHFLGSSVTNFVAASRLWNFPSVDLAIVNAGEVKTDLAPGNFTVADAKELLPYPNTLVILQIEGKQLIVALERALQKLVDDFSLLELNETMSGGAYPYGAGIRYNVNMSQAFPNRLSNIQVNPQLAQDDWSPIDLNQNYSLVTSSYLAGGGDGYNEFNRLPEEAVNDTEIPAVAAFLTYCQHVQVLLEPPLSQFSTQLYSNDMYNWSCHCQFDHDHNR